MRATLMHNPHAGTGDPPASELLSILRATGYEPAYQSTKVDGYADALQDPGDLVVVAGGDGTIRKVANHLAGSTVPMAILPVGTANNIAGAFGLGGSPRQLANGWREAGCRRLRVGAVSGSEGEKEFVESVGIGFFAETMFDFERHRGRGRGSDPHTELDRVRRDLRERLPRFPETEWTVTLDDEQISGSFLAVVAMNVGRLGPRVVLAPNADPGDELLRVVTLGAEDREDLMRLLSDEIADVPAFPVRECRRLRLRPSGVLRVDGKFFSPRRTFGEEVEVRLTDRFVNVLVSA